MTQDSSINNINISLDDKPVKKPLVTASMLHNGRSIIKENMRLFIVLLILHMVSMPLTLIMIIQDLFTTGYGDADAYMVIAVLATGAAAASGIICALIAMPYLYKKSVVDMRLSLPMTTGQRFASDYIGGLVLYIVPLLISQVFTWVIMLIGHLTCDGRTFYRSGGRVSYECHIFEESAPILIKGVIGGIAIMLMYYALTVLVSSCCGSIFECICYTLMANVLIPVTILLLIYGFTSGIAGLSADVYMSWVMPYTSPGGGVFGLTLSLGDGYSSSNVPNTGITFGKWLVIYLIVTAIYIAASYFIYKKRKAEDTGTPVIFGVFYHIIMTLVLVCINCTFYWDGDRDMILPMIIITAIIYMIFHVIRNRGFAHFVKGIVCYVATMAVCWTAFIIVGVTDLFGAGRYVPDANAVKDIYISYNGYFDKASRQSFGSIDYYSDDSNIALVTSKENIQAVIDAHAKTIELLNDPGASFDYGSDRLRVMYRMKSGRTIIRSYDYLLDDSREILSKMDMTDEFKQFRADKIYDEIIQNNEIVKNGVERESNYLSSNYATVSPQWTYSGYSSEAQNSLSIPLSNLPSDFYTRLAECLRDDILNESESDYFSSNGGRWNLAPLKGYNYIIKENYTSTLAYLREVGFDKLPEVSDAAVNKFVNEHWGINMVNTEILEKLTGKEVISSTELILPTEGWYYTLINAGTENEYSHNINTSRYASVRYYGDDLTEVLRVAKKKYKTDENCYTISVNGNHAVIPAQYSDKAEKLYIRLVAEDFFYRFYEAGYGDGYYNYPYDYYDGDYYDSYYYDGDSVIPQEYYYGEYYTYGFVSEEEIRDYKIFLKAFIECCGESDIIAVAGSDVYYAIAEYAGK